MVTIQVQELTMTSWGTKPTRFLTERKFMMIRIVLFEYDADRADFYTALLSGTDLLRLGEGFSGSAGDSDLHRICAAVRQAVSGGMLVMRAGAGSFCGRLLNGQGRRPCRRHRWNWLKAIIKGGGLPALLSLLWDSGDAGTEITRPPCGFTFPKEVEADT